MGGSSHTETSNSVDPKLMALYQQNYDRASQVADQPFQPYTGERVAGFNPNQMAGFNSLLSAAGDPIAGNAIRGAQNAVGSLLNFQAPTVGSPGNLTPQTIAARSIAPSLVQAPTVSAAPAVSSVGVNAGLLAGTDLAPYLNPYTDDVVNAALGDLSHARQMQGVPDATGCPDDAPSGIAFSAVGEAETINDGQYDQVAEQLKALQDWVRQQQTVK